MKKQWYEELFTDYAESYDKEPYTQGTVGEVDFIEQEIKHNKQTKILDIGCGTGRHALELTRRGYTVTGIDLSPSQLERARQKAQKENLTIDFRQADARRLTFDKQFDLVMMICEGAFPLMETDEMNFQILENAARALKDGGKLILTTLSAFFPLYHSVQDFLQEHGLNTTGHSFDLLTFRDHSTFEITDDLGKRKKMDCSERYYSPSEITWYLKSLGFRDIAIHGCHIGAFSRSVPLTAEDHEMLVIASK